MFILGIEFLALIVICYVFFIYATRDHLSESKGRSISSWVVGAAILILLAMILLASWYVQLGLSN